MSIGYHSGSFGLYPSSLSSHASTQCETTQRAIFVNFYKSLFLSFILFLFLSLLLPQAIQLQRVRGLLLPESDVEGPYGDAR